MGQAVIVGGLDPGAHENAIAVYLDGVLQYAGIDIFPKVDVLIIERPQADARTRSIDLRNILDLAWNAARAAGRFEQAGAEIVERTPTQWKGSEPKPLHHSRLWHVLSEEEREVLGGRATQIKIEKACEKGGLKRWKISGGACYPKSQKQLTDLLDAAALGAHYLGRLPRV